MKFLFLIFSFILSTAQAREKFENIVQLPTVTINEETLGGDVLLINMKDYMVIQGNQSKVLETELGTDLKKNFTRDIVMNESVESLRERYGNLNRPVTNELINLYSEIVSMSKKRKKLN